MTEEIHLRGVSTHNLKNIDVSFPLGEYSVVTGVSGSGKSSLVFDSLYAESYRRYVDSLSSFARQYLKALPRPEMEEVINLPPAIAVGQNRGGGHQRSTVGTLTEVSDLIGLMMAHGGSVICPNCSVPVVEVTPESTARFLLQSQADKKAVILAPLDSWKNFDGKLLQEQLLSQGLSRIWGEKQAVERLDEKTNTKKLWQRAVVVDRITMRKSQVPRLTEALEMAFKLSRGVLRLVLETGEELTYERGLVCRSCREHFDPPAAAMFSFNHPLGACETCQGYGLKAEVDWEKVTPDMESSLLEKGVAPWNFGEHSRYLAKALKEAKVAGIDVDKAFKSWTKAEWSWLRDGAGKWFGVKGYFKWLDSKKYKAHYRIHAARFRKYVICDDCDGFRLKKTSQIYSLNGKSHADLHNMRIKDLSVWLEGLLIKESRVQANTTLGLDEAVAEMSARLNFLQRVGLDYLSLARATKTLSGGEQQRIQLARCLGSVLTDTLFCLDEPSVGLHARDSKNLLGVLHDLRDQGNSVVVVEHEEVLIRGADYLVEIGPKSGHEGGHITFSGKPKRTKKAKQSRQTTENGAEFKKFLHLKNASINNLKQVSCKFPVGALTVVCGVSGSGKSSLIQHCLYSLLKSFFEGDAPTDGVRDLGNIGPKSAINQHGKVLLVSQGALGRSSRSNIASYLGVYDHIRKLFSEQPKAKQQKLKPGAFSFNVAGGRCEVCKGMGYIEEDLSFLGEMNVTCPQCEGRRFEEKVLQIRYQNKNLIDVLGLTVAEARNFFDETPKISRVLQEAVDLGLGYLTLGQNTSSFSGGEAQRLKLISVLKENTAKLGASILIFDEPSTGLADKDVKVLTQQMHDLCGRGHTVIVVEHHLGMIRDADWIVEVGPEAADEGGQLVYQGPVSGLGACEQSRTAEFL